LAIITAGCSAKEEKATAPAMAATPQVSATVAPTPVQAEAKANAAAKPKPEEAKHSNSLMSGESGLLLNEVFVGVGEKKDNYDEMFTYITKNNQDALKGNVTGWPNLLCAKGNENNRH
jgi:phage protein D